MIPVPRPSLLETLRAEREATSRFVDLLRREQQVLTGGSVDELEMLTPQKVRLANELAAYVRTRRERLLALGHTPDGPGMRAWAAGGDQPETASLWESLHALAGQAKALNETNGALIDMRVRHCERSLAALNEASGRSALYGRRGETVMAPPVRTSLRA